MKTFFNFKQAGSVKGREFNVMRLLEPALKRLLYKVNGLAKCFYQRCFLTTSATAFSHRQGGPINCMEMVHPLKVTSLLHRKACNSKLSCLLIWSVKTMVKTDQTN